MRHAFFDPENGLFSTLSLLVDVVGCSILWVFLCVPIVTIGPATAALYFTVVHRFRQGASDTFTAFFRSLWRERKQGCVCSLALAALAALFAFLYRWYALAADTLGSVGQFAYSFFYGMLLLLIALFLWLFPLMGRFSFSTGKLFSTAFRMLIVHLPTTLLLLLLTAAVYAAIVRLPILLFVLPSLWMLLLSLPLERAFGKHLP